MQVTVPIVSDKNYFVYGRSKARRISSRFGPISMIDMQPTIGIKFCLNRLLITLRLCLSES